MSHVSLFLGSSGKNRKQKKDLEDLPELLKQLENSFEGNLLLTSRLTAADIQRDLTERNLWDDSVGEINSKSWQLAWKTLLQETSHFDEEPKGMLRIH